jgi:hypothetical protein
MAQSKEAEKFDPDEVYPVTTEAPAQDDQQAPSSATPARGQPGPHAAAGPADRRGHGRRRRLEHKPPDPDQFDRDGRPIGPIKVADNTDADARENAADASSTKK